MDICEYHQNIHGHHTYILYDPGLSSSFNSRLAECMIQVLAATAGFKDAGLKKANQMKRLTGSPGFFDDLGDKV